MKHILPRKERKKFPETVTHWHSSSQYVCKGPRWEVLTQWSRKSCVTVTLRGWWDNIGFKRKGRHWHILCHLELSSVLALIVFCFFTGLMFNYFICTVLTVWSAAPQTTLLRGPSLKFEPGKAVYWQGHWPIWTTTPPWQNLSCGVLLPL